MADTLKDQLLVDIANMRVENGRMREALQFIASQEDLMFAECSVAEEIVRRAKAALELK